MSSDNDDTNKHDLTRIEDLSEFLHEEDEQTDALFDEEGDQEDQDHLPPTPDFDNQSELSDLDDDLNEQYDDQSDDATEDYGEEFSYEQDSEEGNEEDDSELPPDFTQDSILDKDQDQEIEEINEEVEDFEDPLAALEDDEEDEEDEGNFEESLEGSFEEDSEEDSEEDLEEDLEDEYQNNQEDHEDPESLQDNTEEDYQENFYQEDEAKEEEDSPPEDFESFSLDEQPEQFPDQSQNQQQAPPPTPKETTQTNVDFNDVKEFAQNMSYGTVATGGNPAFSLLLTGVSAEESLESILATLNEHELIQGDEKLIRDSISRGQLLIPQISEYSAIFLAGKLRKYATQVSIGLAEQIHSSKSYEHDNKGSMTKRSIFQNRDLKFKKEDSDFLPEDIITSSANNIHGHIIKNHFGVITANKTIDLGSLIQTTREYEVDGQQTSENFQESFGQSEVYEVIIKSLKETAYKRGANALLSINYTLSPIVENSEQTYHIIATADAVFIQESIKDE